MVRYSEGSWRAKGSGTQLFVYARDDEGGSGGNRRMVTLMCADLDPIADERKVRTRLLEWRDGLVGEAAVEEARRAGELACPEPPSEIVESVARRLGINDESLARSRRDYLSDYVSMRSRSSSGRGSYGSSSDILRLWLLPYLPDPDASMASLSPAEVHEFLGRLRESGRAGTTQHKSWVLLKAAVRHAVNVDGLRPDPTYGIQGPSRSRPRINHLDPTRADALAVELARAVQSPAVCAARLALAAGIECAAASGLTLAACDPASVDAVHITQNITKVRGRWQVGPTKNEYRSRVIPINDELRSILTDRIAELRRQSEALGHAVGPETFLLANPSSDRPFPTPAALQKSWSTLSEAYGLVGACGKRVTLHDLRHTFATSFLAKGGSFSDLKALMGHASGYMTLEVYAGSDPELRRLAMEETGREVPSHEDVSGRAHGSVGQV